MDIVKKNGHRYKKNGNIAKCMNATSIRSTSQLVPVNVPILETSRQLSISHIRSSERNYTEQHNMW